MPLQALRHRNEVSDSDLDLYMIVQKGREDTEPPHIIACHHCPCFCLAADSDGANTAEQLSCHRIRHMTFTRNNYDYHLLLTTYYLQAVLQLYRRNSPLLAARYLLIRLMGHGIWSGDGIPRNNHVETLQSLCLGASHWRRNLCL